MQKLSFFCGISLFLVAPLSAWDWVVDFSEFGPGPAKYEDPADPIAQFVRITGMTDGVPRYGVHWIGGHPDAATGWYYLETAGTGVHEGRLDAAIALDRPIGNLGTLYLRFERSEWAGAGWRTKAAFGLSAETVVADPDEPWGWRGPTGDEARAAGMVIEGYWLFAGDGELEQRTNVGLYYTSPHEIWLAVDAPAGRYRLYVRGGDFPEQTRIDPPDSEPGGGGGWWSFRDGAVDALRTLVISTDAGRPDRPNWYNNWLLDAVAVDSEAHNLSKPPIGTSGGPIVHHPTSMWGLPVIEFGWAETWVGGPAASAFEITHAPWVRDYLLNTWMWVDGFRGSPNRPLPADEAGIWAYIWNSGVPAPSGMHKWGFPVDGADAWRLDGGAFLGSFDGREAPWVYSYTWQSWWWVDILSGVPPQDDTPAHETGTWGYLSSSPKWTIASQEALRP